MMRFEIPLMTQPKNSILSIVKIINLQDAKILF